MCDTSEDGQLRRRQLVLAAEQGDAGAQCMLGRMHHEGDGGPVDFAEARRLLGSLQRKATPRRSVCSATCTARAKAGR